MNLLKLSSILLCLVLIDKAFGKDIVCSDDLRESVEVNQGETFSYKTQAGKKYSPKTSCSVSYRPGKECDEIKFACSEFNLKNKDSKNCKKGDKMIVVADGDKKFFCGKKSPVVKASSSLRVVFSTNKRKQSTGGVCTVTCTSSSSTSSTTSTTAPSTAAPITTPPPAPNPCDGGACETRTYFGSVETLSLYTKNIWAIWWDPKFDHAEDAKKLADILIYVRNDCLMNLGMADPPNPGSGYYYNVYIHHGADDMFPEGWAMGQGTDPFGFPYLTLGYGGLFSSNPDFPGSKTVYHEGYHVFQYELNSVHTGKHGTLRGKQFWILESQDLRRTVHHSRGSSMGSRTDQCPGPWPSLQETYHLLHDVCRRCSSSRCQD